MSQTRCGYMALARSCTGQVRGRLVRNAPLSPRHTAGMLSLNSQRPLLQALIFRRKFLATYVAGGARKSLALDTWAARGRPHERSDLATVRVT